MQYFLFRSFSVCLSIVSLYGFHYCWLDRVVNASILNMLFALMMQWRQSVVEQKQSDNEDNENIDAALNELIVFWAQVIAYMHFVVHK